MTAEYINDHNSIYNYLLRYFLPELSDPHFRQEAAQEIEQNERMTYCRYMAAWLPYQPHYKEILNQLNIQTRNDDANHRTVVFAFISTLKYFKEHPNDIFLGVLLIKAHFNDII